MPAWRWGATSLGSFSSTFSRDRGRDARARTGTAARRRRGDAGVHRAAASPTRYAEPRLPSRWPHVASEQDRRSDRRGAPRSVADMTHRTRSTATSPSTTSTSRIAFYRDALGLEIVNDVASGGHRWVSLGIPTRSPGLGIVLSDPHAGRSPERRRGAASAAHREGVGARSAGVHHRRSGRHVRAHPRHGCRGAAGADRSSRGVRATARSATRRATSSASTRRDDGRRVRRPPAPRSTRLHRTGSLEW